MALSADDRIAISLKIVQVPHENAKADQLIADIGDAKIAAQKEDDSNKNLMNDQTALVNPYQTELERYDGNGRTQLVEQDLLDSANRTLQNPFFPNDPQTPLPSVPDGVWKLFPAFSGGKGIGKDYNEAYSVVTKEQDLIDAINTEIATVEAFVDATRSSGDECVGTCTGETPPGSGVDETTCLANGGTWNENKVPSTAMAAAATALKDAVQAWEDFMNTTYGVIPTGVLDPDPTRSVQNDAARQNITDTIAEIDTWQALQDFDTTTVTPSSCAAFNAFPASSFDPSKFRSTELQDIKDAITSRVAFIAIRNPQVSGYLGSVTQDFGTGEISAATGFLGTRFRLIDMRLNSMGGSLTRLNSLDKAIDAQEQLKKSNANAGAAYSGVLTATQFRSPGSGNKNVHVLDSTGFSVSDTVYIAALNQEELTGVIQSIDGNRVVLDINIPKKYRETALARLYKVL